jgi:hypothetical protein
LLRAATTHSASAGGRIVMEEKNDGHVGLGWAILARWAKSSLAGEVEKEKKG